MNKNNTKENKKNWSKICITSDVRATGARHFSRNSYAATHSAPLAILRTVATRSPGGDEGRGVAGNYRNFYYAFWLPCGSMIHELRFRQSAAGAWGGEPRLKWPTQLPWVAGMTVFVVFTVSWEILSEAMIYA